MLLHTLTSAKRARVPSGREPLINAFLVEEVPTFYQLTGLVICLILAQTYEATLIWRNNNGLIAFNGCSNQAAGFTLDLGSFPDRVDTASR